MPKPTAYRFTYRDWRDQEIMMVGKDPSDCMTGWHLTAIETWCQRSDSDAYQSDFYEYPSHKVKWSNG